MKIKTKINFIFELKNMSKKKDCKCKVKSSAPCDFVKLIPHKNLLLGGDYSVIHRVYNGKNPGFRSKAQRDRIKKWFVSLDTKTKGGSFFSKLFKPVSWVYREVAKPLVQRAVNRAVDRATDNVVDRVTGKKGGRRPAPRRKPQMRIQPYVAGALLLPGQRSRR